MSKDYSPFPNKPLLSLLASDLTVLSTVSEGWYVEYKRETPNTKSLAKSISSFANTLGGWLFIGVDEKRRDDNTASSCPGIAKADMDGVLQAIRQSAASQINPTPFFEVFVVWGPNQEMELTEDRGVVCIEIPQSNVAPHVHSSGCIYRRVSDSSEPKPENDRHQLDTLWGRRELIHKDYRQWIARKPQRNETEKRQPYLRLLLEGDLYGKSGKTWDLSTKDVKDALDKRTSPLSLPFEAVYPSSSGVVARQLSSLSSHGQFGLTLIVGKGLRSEVWIPINSFEIEDTRALVSNLGKYRNFKRFHEKLQLSKASEVSILDLNSFLMIVIAISSQYLELIKVAKVNIKKLFVKVILSDVRNTIPFLDSGIVLDRVDTFGVPLCLTNESVVPDGDDADSFFEINIHEEEKDRLSPFLECAFWIFEMICRALGIQGVFAEPDIVSSKDEITALIDELLDAWERAKSSR